VARAARRAAAGRRVSWPPIAHDSRRRVGPVAAVTAWSARGCVSRTRRTGPRPTGRLAGPLAAPTGDSGISVGARSAGLAAGPGSAERYGRSSNSVSRLKLEDPRSDDRWQFGRSDFPGWDVGTASSAVFGPAYDGVVAPNHAWLPVCDAMTHGRSSVRGSSTGRSRSGVVPARTRSRGAGAGGVRPSACPRDRIRPGHLEGFCGKGGREGPQTGHEAP